MYVNKTTRWIFFIFFICIVSKVFYAMEKSEIQKLINSKSERIVYESSVGTSKVWKSFSRIKVDDAFVNFVKCLTCNNALKWKSKDGTSGLNAHIRSCTGLQAHSPRTVPEVFRNLSSIQRFQSSAPAVVKSDLADAVVRMCATDIRYVNIFVNRLCTAVLVI